MKVLDYWESNRYEPVNTDYPNKIKNMAPAFELVFGYTAC